MAHDVFVSYSQQDKVTADAIVARLEQDGTRCWIAPRDIVPGTSWGEAIVDAIAGSRVMVLVLSANSNRSRQVLREVERAVAGDVIVLPFRIEQMDPTGALAYFLGTEHWLDAITPPMQAHIERLSRTVRLLISSEPVPREELDRPPAGLGRRRRRPWALPATLGAVALVAITIALVAALGQEARDGPGSSASPGGPATGGPPASADGASPSPAVALEEVGRYRPADLDPTDLAAPGPITGFDIEGTELAYANGPDGVTRLSIADPPRPSPVATYPVPDAVAVAFIGEGLAAVSGEFGTLGIAVFAGPGPGFVTAPIEAADVTSLYGIEGDGGYAYVASHDYVAIVDARSPDQPRVVFDWVPPEHTGNPATVFVADGRAYVGAGWDGLYVFDVSRPEAPALLGHWVSSDWVIDVVAVDGIAYVTMGDSGVAAIDMADPANPRLLGSLTVPGFASPLDVAGGHAFVGWLGATGTPGGVAVVDVTDPATPVLAGTFGRFPMLAHLGVANGHLFVADEGEGLVIYRIAGLD